ncbi:uncharacterized protein LOC131597458 [Vicia villosa]|uniref:uncharacterized protein LOC131597458 n=1 Tax=Vicia villosa TaxID=3911 RepID=UPI00273BA8F3|nr:uncharacterized protein LOC131597458 [Vicia villosa]
MLLKEWRTHFNVKQDMLRTMPLWVKLPQLPLHLWGARSLNKIGSAIGMPLVTDECTAHKLRVSYARILVEVDVTRKLVEEITLKDNEGRKMKQAIEHEWKPKFCDKFQRMGHICGEPTLKKVWKPKQQQVVEPPEKPITTTPPVADTIEEIEEEWTKASKCVRDKAWNVRGLNKSGKAREISSRLLELAPEFLILLETRVKANKADAVRNKLSFKGTYLDDYNKHLNGRIWLGWDHNKWNLRYVSSSSQHIHCGVYDTHGDFHFWITAIYAHNTLEERRRLWTKLETIHMNQQGPWCVLGDYNNVANAQDRIGGQMVTEAEYKDMQISDHAILYIRGNTIGKFRGTFRFKNYLTTIEGYDDLVAHSWRQQVRGRPMVILWHKLRRLQTELKRFGKPSTDVKIKLVKARQELEQVQENLRTNRFNIPAIEEIKRITEEIIHWNTIEESIMQQRTKIDWLIKGDGNTAFFHAYLKSKNRAKGMWCLQNSNSDVLTNQEDIEKEVMDFYTNLMDTQSRELEQIDIDAMRRGNQVSMEQRAYLVSPITLKEVEDALKGIGDLKSPGVDGYGAKFSKASWKTIKEDVVAAVMEFFDHCRLYKPFNRTAVTLIPKSNNVKTVKEFRPIAGCTTFYKIISKVLTTRLGKVLPDIISLCQAAFVPGQKIHHHILLAFELMKGYERKGGTPRCMLQLDLQKAYDMVDWRALEEVMYELGLPM